MVAGATTAITGAATYGGARGERGLEREEEGEEVPKDEWLTQRALGWPAGAGVAGLRRIRARTRRPEAGEGADGAANGGLPPPIPWPGMKSTARRTSW